MTWQTAAVRYVAIGEKSARFRDLTLPFTADDEPVESVIWLPNGGGKSSLMSMKSAVVLPAARDFTGAGREDGEKRPRRLDDYVDSGDTSHTVIEWTRDDATSLFGSRHRLLTGAVYEWPDRHRPTLDQSVTLNKLWWSAVPADGVLSLDHLPVRDGRLLTLNQFHDRLRALNAAHPELQIRFARTQNQWEEQLADLGIDTALYRYQARMNTSEGGIAKVFNFNTVRDFIDLVVDVIAAPEQAADCGKVVNEHAKNLFRRPSLLTERAFLTEAKQLLVELDAAHALVHAAVADRDAARASAQRLRAALTLAVAQHEAGVAIEDSRAETYQKGATEARAERGRVDGVRAELLFLAATEERAEAGRALDGAQEDEAAARADHTAWAAAGPLAEAAGHEATATELREQLQPERAARQQLRLRLDAYAMAARALLEEQAADFTAQAELARTEAQQARTRRKALTTAVEKARSEEAEFHKAEAAARALLQAHDRDLAAALRDGHLEAGEAPTTALDRHTSAARTAEAAVEEHSNLEQEHQTAATKAGAAATSAAEEYADLVAEARDLEADEQRLQEAHAALANHPRLVELAEAESSVDVWGDAVRLRRRLEEAARKAEADALRTAVDSADDVRLISAVDATGLLPAPVATLAAADQLTGTGVAAETAWSVLARDYAPDARARAAARRPDIASGVVVQDAAARERAETLLVSHPTLAHIPLVTAEELAHAAAEDAADMTKTLTGTPLPAVPLHEGLHLPDAATVAAEQLRSRGRSREEEQAALTQRAAADRALHQTLATFLADYPDAESIPRASRLLESARLAASRKLEEKTELAQQRDEELRRAKLERDNAAEQLKIAGRHQSAAAVIARLAETSSQLEEHRTTIEQATAALEALRGRLQRLEDDVREAGDAISASETKQQARERDASAARSDAAQIRVLDPDAPPSLEQVAEARHRGLTTCLASYQTLVEQWQTEAVGSVLEAQLVAAERQTNAALQRAQRTLAGFTGDRDAAEALARQHAADHDSDTCEREASTAQTRLEQAIARVATLSAGVTVAQQALDAASEERRTRPRVTDPVEFTTVEDARARAAELARKVTELVGTETELARSRDQARQRAAAERELAENLQDQADRLPAADAGGTVAEVDAFDGDLPDARRRVRAAVERLKSTEEEVAEAREQRAGYSSTALKLATHTAYQNLTLTLRDRLADGDPDRLGGKAAEYAGEVTTRLTHVEDLLVQIGEDEKRVSQLVTTHVRQLLSNIHAANRASVLPPGLGELSGKRFINLRFTDPTDDELTSRVTQEIHAMLDSAHGETKSLPSGETILRRSVHAAAGVKGFRVDVLKPNEHMVEQRVPVVDVARFSDGEKLTTCVLLFCAFARMRQRSRTGGATGTLMLDNPFGRASNAQLVALQLAVARAQRVHLVYATGLEDMGALLQFRRLIRLRNRKPVGSIDGHVQLADAGGARVGEVSGVSVARPTAPVPAGLAGDRSGEVPDGSQPAGDRAVAVGDAR